LTDAYFPLETPIGQMWVAYNAAGISAVLPAAGRADVQAAEPTPVLKEAVTKRLQGKWRDLRFDLRGLSEFQQAVLRKTQEIPRGEVRPYAWVAREIGSPKAVRAVGSALANNPVPLLIPCHRVVRSDGAIGQYGLGAANKRIMLEAEGVNPVQLEELGRQGVRYVGSGTTKIYCFPTCRNARRITSQHRRLFRSETEAAAAGFQPCKVCRPGAIAVAS
jgi:O-6-methylguanine DNA methyltransferase